jgi:hypothetical protein
MKKHVTEFLRRGLVACGFGPMVLTVLYLILHRTGAVDMLTVKEVCVGMFSVSALAFIAGGMNFIYQIERLPLMLAILIHGCVLYVSYLATYLINSWLEWGPAPILSFTGIFVVGYLMIWAVIYTIIKRNTDKINAVLKQKQNNL